MFARNTAPGCMTDYLAKLNEEQRLAVETLDGPLLVLAGAGTGKTRVLTTRFAHILLTRRAFPNQVLAVTFTNKAAREMRERVGALLGQPAEGLWLGTFHALCARMLRRHAEHVGLTSSFSILDTDDQIRLLKQVMEALRVDAKRWAPPAVMGILQRWKDRGQTPDRVPPGEEGDFAGGRLREIYTQYQQRLRALNAADFGDLLLHTTEILRTQPDVLAQYHRSFRYILVDEYQDTNVVQYLWLRLLAQSHKNICCVGDDDQSIYSWRGAEVENILRFEHDFENARIVRLEQNYRSTAPILGAAAGLIANNEGRLGKTLRSGLRDAAGEKVSVVSLWDSDEEGAHGGRARGALAPRWQQFGRHGDTGARRFPDAVFRRAHDHLGDSVSRGGRIAVLRARRNTRRHRLHARAAPAERRPGLRAYRERAAPRRGRRGAAGDARCGAGAGNGAVGGRGPVGGIGCVEGKGS